MFELVEDGELEVGCLFGGHEVDGWFGGVLGDVRGGQGKDREGICLLWFTRGKGGQTQAAAGGGLWGEWRRGWLRFAFL